MTAEELAEAMAASPAWSLIRVPLRVFVAEMESALRRKDPDRGRQGWQGVSVDWLFARAIEECGEAFRAIRSVRSCESPDAREAFCVAAQRELADAANFLMMVHDRIGSYRKGHGGAP